MAHSSLLAYTVRKARVHFAPGFAEIFLETFFKNGLSASSLPKGRITSENYIGDDKLWHIIEDSSMKNMSVG